MAAAAGPKEREGEVRFAHLLQPYRDLAANWSVDVAQELEAYLSELHLTPLFQDGQGCLNFAEAALLIQGSIQVYSKKVEYLYILVLQALDFITQRRQPQQEKCSVQAEGKDPDFEEEEEEEFLNLDDVPEEANIDINDEEAAGTPIPLVKPPASLLVVEGDTLDMVGDAGELANYQIATSYLHRDFLLLDPCDADAVDRYLNITSTDRRAEKGTPRPPSSLRPRSQRGSTPGRRASSKKKTQGGDDIFEGVDTGPDDGDEPWVGDARNINFDDPFVEKRDGHNQPVEQQLQDEDDVDPWAPLNPHEPGTLPLKPYKRGRPSRKLKARDPFSLVPELEFPLATRNGTTFPEFLEALQAKEAAERLKRNSGTDSHSSLPEKLKTNSWTADANPEREQSDDEADHGAENFEAWDRDFPEAGENELPQIADAPQGDPGQNTEECFENLCHAKRDSVLQKLAEAELRTELAARVSNWKQKIEISLEVQDARPAFDIHVYGERLIDKCIHEAPKDSDGTSSFAELVKGQETHDVARSFAALLQLVNNGNVLIQRDNSSDCTLCFTAQSSFSVKLLSCRKVHEEMLHYQAPSHGVKKDHETMKDTKSKTPSRRGKRHATGSNSVSSPRLRPESRDGEAFTGTENVAPKSLRMLNGTPESKRKCKRQPLQAVQVEVNVNIV